MNDLCFFVSDLHGKKRRYEKLFEAIREQQPGIVLLGGDLLPHPRRSEFDDFLMEYLALRLDSLRQDMGADYPFIGLILGNDDARCHESSVIKGMEQGLWTYLHFRQATIAGFDILGYSYVPPTPFLLKDWERYDVSRYVNPGCLPPTEGRRTVQVSPDEAEYSTIQKDLEILGKKQDLSRTIFLFHAPPHESYMDRADLDGRQFEHTPLDMNVGSIAIQRFIEKRQPYLTLHGHVHESSRITGHWKQTFGKTISFTAAYEGEELALIIFPLHSPAEARRELL